MSLLGTRVRTLLVENGDMIQDLDSLQVKNETLQKENRVAATAA